jgi:hypothetical protein
VNDLRDQLTPGELDVLQLALLNLKTRLQRDTILASEAGAIDASRESIRTLEKLDRLAAKFNLKDYV